MKFLRSPWALPVSIALFLLAIGAYLMVKPPPEYDLRVVNPPSIIASLPHWVAVEKGFYRDERLRVKTISASNSALMVQAIQSGDADVLPAVSLLDILQAQSAPLDRPLLFSHSRMRVDPAFESILVPTASPLATLQDLAGKRIAVYPGASSTEAIKLVLRDNGVDPATVTFRPLPPPEHLKSLERSDVDASHLYEPLRTQALRSGQCRVLLRSVYATLVEPCAIGASAISARYVQEHPDAAAAYLRAWDRAVRFIRENPQESRALLARHLGLTPEVATEATWVDATLVGELDPLAVERTVAMILRMGLLAQKPELADVLYRAR